MDLSSINIFSEDVGQVLFRQIGKVNLVIAAGVCRAWRSAICADKHELYWSNALKFIAVPIKSRSSYEIFAERISVAFKLHREGLKQFCLIVLTNAELEALEWEAKYPQKFATELEMRDNIRRLHKEALKKWVALSALNEGVLAAITLYHADHLDISVLESYLEKLDMSYDNLDYVSLVASAEYKKTSEVHIANRWIVKLPTCFELRHQLLEIIVKKHLYAKDFNKAIEAIKPYQNSPIRDHISFYDICGLVRAAALVEKRIDIIDRLLGFIPEDALKIWAQL